MLKIGGQTNFRTRNSKVKVSRLGSLSKTDIHSDRHTYRQTDKISEKNKNDRIKLKIGGQTNFRTRNSKIKVSRLDSLSKTDDIQTDRQRSSSKKKMKKYLVASKSKNRTNRQTQTHASRRPLLSSSSSCQIMSMSQSVDPIVQNLSFDIVSCKRGLILMVFCQVLAST